MSIPATADDPYEDLTREYTDEEAARLARAALDTFPVTEQRTGNGNDGAFPVSKPMGAVTGNAEEERPLYGDVAALLDGGIPEPPAPSVLSCSDGVCLFYTGKVNQVFGDPESGKTWLALAAVAALLDAGGSGAVVDLDHNGMSETVQRLLDLGAPADALRSLARFRFAEPDDGAHVLAVVDDLKEWSPNVVVVDSIGELLPMFGANSNSPDDYTRVSRRTLAPLARSGSAVVVIDHLAKNSDSRSMGATGTAAKKRTFNGTSLRVAVVDQFAPGQGGSARVTVAKDRPGGLRKHRPATGSTEPLAAMFRLHADSSFKLSAPTGDERPPADLQAEVDALTLDQLDPKPASVRDVQKRMNWQTARAGSALRKWRERQTGAERAG